MVNVIAAVFWSAVLLGALTILLGHLVTLLRSDRHGSVPPPRSHHDEVDAQARR